MRCATCDELLAEGAVFCKRCGAPARALLAKPLYKLAELAMLYACATGVVAVAGLAFAFAVLSSLLKRGVEASSVGGIFTVCVLGVVVLAWLLARQSSRALNAYLRPFTAPAPAPPQLEPRTTAQLLDAPREPAPSVTEHTTRTFDPAYVERAKK